MSLLLTVSLGVLSTGQTEAPRPVVISTDCGVETDDQWAIAHLVLSPRFDVRGIVTTHAPGLTPEASVRAVRTLLDGLRPVRRPEVVAGSGLPLADRRPPGPGPRSS
jgi:inosine-uridine nucleoside N-ribohydrolase